MDYSRSIFVSVYVFIFCYNYKDLINYVFLLTFRKKQIIEKYAFEIKRQKNHQIRTRGCLAIL